MKETVHKNHQGTHAESHFYKLSSELYSQMCYQFTWDCFLLGDGTDWGFEWGSCFFTTTIYCPPGAAFVPHPCTWPCGPLLTTNPGESSASRADNADLKIRGFLYILTWEVCRGWPQNVLEMGCLSSHPCWCHCFPWCPWPPRPAVCLAGCLERWWHHTGESAQSTASLPWCSVCIYINSWIDSDTPNGWQQTLHLTFKNIFYSPKILFAFFFFFNRYRQYYPGWGERKKKMKKMQFLLSFGILEEQKGENASHVTVNLVY